MKITTVHCAINFVALEMILLVTTHVIKMETKPAWKVGWEKNVNKLCVNKDVICSMGVAVHLGNASVIMVGKDSSVMSVSATQAVLMGAVMNHGSVIVKPTGVACSVTKI